jgi:uncharacterized phiE125 gp8 family phage protein
MRDILRIVTPASEFAVTVNEAKAHMSVPDSESDDLISAYVQAAEQSLAFIGRCLKPTSFALDLYDWRREIELPMPPLRTVTAVKARGTDGTLATLDTASYLVSTTSEGRGIIRMLGTHSWLPLDWGQVALPIEFTAGYDEVPAALRAAILLTAESNV